MTLGEKGGKEKKSCVCKTLGLIGGGNATKISNLVTFSSDFGKTLWYNKLAFDEKHTKHAIKHQIAGQVMTKSAKNTTN